MFTLPSMWNIIISTIAFVIAAWYIRRLLDEHGVPKGITRGLVVFVLAYVVSWGSGELVDWAHEKVYGREQGLQIPNVQTSQDLNQLLKDTGLTPP
jgi:hypothetical protein